MHKIKIKRQLKITENKAFNINSKTMITYKKRKDIDRENTLMRKEISSKNHEREIGNFKRNDKFDQDFDINKILNILYI
jgi:hypothetical protein